MAPPHPLNTDPDRPRWGLILVLWLAGLGAAAQYGKTSVVFPELAALYPGGEGQASWIVSVVGVVGILFGVIAGDIVGHFGARRILLICLGFGAVLSAAQAALPPYPVMLTLRVLEGVSHLGIVVAAPTLVAGFAGRDQALAMSLWSTFFSVAYAILVWVGLPLVAVAGIGALYGAHAVWMIVMALILALALPRSQTTPSPPQTLSAVLRAHVQIYRSPALAAPALGWLFYTFCFVGSLTLLQVFLAPGLRGPVLGAMPLVAILVSMTLGVWVLRRFGALPVLLVGFALSALCALGLALAPGSAALALAFSAALGLVQGASFAAVPEWIAGSKDRALANGGMAQMGNLGNTLGTPSLAWGIGQGGGLAFGGILAGVLIMGGLSHLALARRRKKDSRCSPNVP